MNRSAYFYLLLVLSAVSLYIVQDFILPVFLGGIVAVVLHRPTRWINVKLRNYKLASILVSIGGGALLVIPLGLLILSGVGEIIHFLQQENADRYTQLVSQFKALIPVINKAVPFISQGEMTQYFYSVVNFLTSKALSSLQSLVVQFPRLIVQLTISIFSSYVFLINAAKIKELVIKNKIFSLEQNKKISQAVILTTNSVVVVSIICGLLQALVMGIVSAAVVPDKVLLVSTITFFFSFIPLIGTSPLTLTLIGTNWYQGNYSAVLVVLIGIGFLTLIDNVWRPLMIGNQAKIPSLMAFLAALGGLSVLGFYGLFMGPILVGVWYHLIKEH